MLIREQYLKSTQKRRKQKQLLKTLIVKMFMHITRQCIRFSMYLKQSSFETWKEPNLLKDNGWDKTKKEKKGFKIFCQLAIIIYNSCVYHSHWHARTVLWQEKHSSLWWTMLAVLIASKRLKTEARIISLQGITRASRCWQLMMKEQKEEPSQQ